MIRYLIIMLSCQLLFLLVYDLFLKKETFFNWNRAYLLITPLVSLVVPFIKLEALTTTAPEPLSAALPVIFLEPGQAVAMTSSQAGTGWSLTLWEGIALAGSLIALVVFLYKLNTLVRLRQKGVLRYFREYLQVEVPEGEIAFSFFRQIFLGKKVLERKHDHIIEHELVHIREKHSWDLLYFEVLRILFWFNPLVYIFQARMTELHEYIADAKMAGNHKKETYQYLLEEVFQTQKISFINSFFNHSLIKKRIVMLHQSRSKQIKKFKYLLMLPLILGMLVYTSCEQEAPASENSVIEELNPQVQQYYKEYKAMVEDGADLFELTSEVNAGTPDDGVMSEEDFYRSNALWILKKETLDASVGLSEGLKEELDRLGSMSYKEYVTLKKSQNKEVHTFTTIAHKPSFGEPCEEGQDAFKCFKQQLDAHVRSTFQYPQEAREQGIQGRVYLNFKIDTDGSVSILQSRASHDLLDAEARRIIEALPKLTPGKKADGTPVAITFAYPIIFKLGDGPVNEDGAYQKYGTPYTKIPVKPSFKTPCEDGQEAFACFREKLDAHVIENFRYPTEAKSAGIEGRVYLYFRIETNGKVNVISARAPHSSLEQEATRIIEALPQLNPGGDEEGNPVPVLFAYPIVFEL